MSAAGRSSTQRAASLPPGRTRPAGSRPSAGRWRGPSPPTTPRCASADAHDEDAVVAGPRRGATVAVARRHEQRPVVEGEDAAQAPVPAVEEGLRGCGGPRAVERHPPQTLALEAAEP